MLTLVHDGGDPKFERHRFRDVPVVSDFVQDRYLPYVKIHKRSWVTDERLLRNHVLPAFGSLRMSRVMRSDIVEFQHGLLERGYKRGTCNRILVVLKYVYNCAIRWDVLSPGSNPCDGVQMLEDGGACERFLTSGEVRRLFAELDANRNVQVAQIIRLLLYTGARKREILDARWTEIDFERQLLSVPASRSKSKKIRHIPLSDAAIDLLQSLPRYDGLPWVFVNLKTGKPPWSIFNAWNTIRKKAGVPGLRLHDLRHSYASFLVNAGRSLYEVQRLLGHHDPKVTMRYAHLSHQAMLEAVNLVGEAVTNAAGKADRSMNVPTRCSRVSLDFWVGAAMADYIVIGKNSHAAHGYLPRQDWSFAAGDQIVPVSQTELGKVLPHYALGFVRVGGEGEADNEYQLVALTGLGSANLYVAPNGKWMAGYVPAALRAYPFRMALHEEQRVLCIAEGHLVEQATEGRLFDDSGELSAVVADTVDFLQKCDGDRQVTMANVAKLVAAGVIDRWPLQVSRGEGEEPLAIEGLYQVNEQALTSLDSQVLHDLRGGPLALAYAQLFSTHQLAELTKRSQFLGEVTRQAEQAKSADLDELFGGENDEISFGF